jgi:hypothetical protein
LATPDEVLREIVRTTHESIRAATETN